MKQSSRGYKFKISYELFEITFNKFIVYYNKPSRKNYYIVPLPQTQQLDLREV